MRHLITILFFAAISPSIIAQSGLLQQRLRQIPGNYMSFSIDNLDNIYLLSGTNQLKKLNANGDSVSVFNDIKKFGEVSLVDVSNPVKIMLYYKGFSTIVILDGMLNLKNTIDLRRRNIFNATATGLSYDGKIWIYDDMDNVLKKLDDEGKVIFKTADFRQVFDKALTPHQIFDRNRLVYLYDSMQGIFVFDYYGAYKNRIDITHWHQLRIADQFITGVANQKIYRYNLSTLQYNEWPIPESLANCRQILVRKDRVYVLKDLGLEIYQLDSR